MIQAALLLVGIAWGQVPLDEPPPAVPVQAEPAPQPAAPPSASASDEDTSDNGDTGQVHAHVNAQGVYEVTVYGADAIREARKKVVKSIEGHGWRQVGTRDGDILFRGPAAWMGKAILDRQGDLSFTTPAVVFKKAETAGPGVAKEGSTDQSGLAQESPGGDYQGISRSPGSGIGAGATFTLFPSKKRTRRVQDDLLVAIQPQLDAYRSAIQATAFQEQLTKLPDRLDALWQTGTPLDSTSAPLQTWAQRREAVLDYWATRADTPEGRDVCRKVETWLQEEVMSSDHPVTAEEQAAANQKAQDTHGRVLHLVGS